MKRSISLSESIKSILILLVFISMPSCSVACMDASQSRCQLAAQPSTLDKRYCTSHRSLGRCNGWAWAKIGVDGTFSASPEISLIHDNFQDAANLFHSDISLITQTTIDRLDRVERLRETWTGPIVVVVAISSANEINQLRSQIQNWKNSRVASFLYNTTDNDYHSKLMRASGISEGVALHINSMRNLAMDLSPTNTILNLDVDFVPSKGMYETFKESFLPFLKCESKWGIIIPHWDMLESESSLPVTFQELDISLKNGLASPFHALTSSVLNDTNNFKDLVRSQPINWPEGIQASQYNRWWMESASGLHGYYVINLQNLQDHIHFEPYVLTQRFHPSGETLPRFHEDFVARNFNKVQWVSHLRAAKYNFGVVRQHFLIHVPHPPSKCHLPFCAYHLRDMRAIYDDFLSHLSEFSQQSSPFETTAFQSDQDCYL